MPPQKAYPNRVTIDSESLVIDHKFKEQNPFIIKMQEIALCPVCLEIIVPIKEAIACCQCGHVFCKDCYQKKDQF